MSATVSYANVVAGSKSTAPQSDVSSIELPSTPESPSAASIGTPTVPTTEASSIVDELADAQLPSPNASPKAGKKQQPVNLAPAPVPSVNAWGSSTAPPVQGTDAVDSHHWPAPNEVTASSNAFGKKAPFVKASSKEKWVPFKAAVVLPQQTNKKSNTHSNGQKKNSSKNSNILGNNNKPASDKKKKISNNVNANNKRQNSQASNKESAKQQQTEKTAVVEQEISLENQEAGVSSTTSEYSGHDSNQDSMKKSAYYHHPQQNQLAFQPHNSYHHNLHTHNSQNSNNHHHSNSNNNTQHFYNNNHPSGQYHTSQPPQYQPFPQQGARPYRPYSGHNRRFNKFQGSGYPNGNTHRHYNSNYVPYQGRRNFYNKATATDYLFPLIKQIEYYFSVENLLKDIFLRKQMNSEGWLDLAVITNFYRMNVLSGGDASLVRKAVEELNGELLEMAEFSNGLLKVKVKENYKTWVLPKEQREPNGKDETELIQIIAPKSKDYQIQIEEEKKEDAVSENTVDHLDSA